MQAHLLFFSQIYKKLEKKYKKYKIVPAPLGKERGTLHDSFVRKQPVLHTSSLVSE